MDTEKLRKKAGGTSRSPQLELYRDLDQGSSILKRLCGYTSVCMYIHIENKLVRQICSLTSFCIELWHLNASAVYTTKKRQIHNTFNYRQVIFPSNLMPLFPCPAKQRNQIRFKIFNVNQKRSHVTDMSIQRRAQPGHVVQILYFVGLYKSWKLFMAWFIQLILHEK